MEHEYLVQYRFGKKAYSMFTGWDTSEEICIGQKKIKSSVPLSTNWTEVERLIQEEIETVSRGIVITLKKIEDVTPL